MLKSLLLTPINLAVKPFPAAKARLDAAKIVLKRWVKLRHFISDLLHAKSFMFWSAQDTSYAKLSSELIFQYHKLEKGLCMAGPRRFFGRDPVIATCRLVKRWSGAGLPSNDPVFLGAIETLRAYRDRLAVTPPPPEHATQIWSLLNECLSLAPPTPSLTTPRPYQPSAGTAATFDLLCAQRRSVRAYTTDVVPISLIHEAIATAQLSPSACNRQPWRLHIYRDPQRTKHLLELQNGNAGFGHQLTTLLVVCADSRTFFDATERNEPYVDAGLFVMSLLLALQSRGLASCCLNWCVSPDTDQKGHDRGDIPSNEKIIMYLAVGYADAQAMVPRSPRRNLETVVTLHEQ
ncbi:nitroreductase family protein [Methylibium petroleiphilum]|uniref:Nitroreductase-like protein n=1 Tax=Methylibium petroleiphilum (strain ATCC BAA-1232 / LMG 22953 / PM1) TaxID=420662 RepID=A2SDQ4_METPP|nr:nitroreductase family protein [Methylibium petroleiphilum]ABM93693.1 nitroreductase-like protein [Methylibium petroleiphilum PM1]